MFCRSHLALICLAVGILTAAWLFRAAQDTGIHGQVVDASGPISGARVRFQAEPDSVLTGPDGAFTLHRPRQKGVKLTAFKEGYLIGSVAADQRSAPTITLARLPHEDCERYHWVDPTPEPVQRHNCGNCHGQLYREWAGSAHARSATNRHFLNLVNGTDWQGHPHVGWSLQADRPEATGVCTACHAPTLEDLNDPAYENLSLVRGVAARGVHCDYCHKIIAADNHKIGLTHGRFGLRLLRPATGQLFFGPLDDVDRHEDSALPVYRQSRYCASCHEGVVLGVHVYSTYSEWQRSPAARRGQECQTCHMVPTGGMTNMAPGKGGIERNPRTLASHTFFASDQQSMLQHCLKVRVGLQPTPAAVTACVTVRAEGVGHKVPTGFVDRSLVLVVDATDAAGRPLAVRSGPILPAAAGQELRGKPGRLYARMLHDDGPGPVPFWRAAPDVDDTRLWPEEEQRVSFAFPSDTAHVRVRLLYRRFWPNVVHSKGWPDRDVEIVDRTWTVGRP